MHNLSKANGFPNARKIQGKGKRYKDMTIKVRDILESKLVDDDTKVYLRFWNGDNFTFLVGCSSSYSILKNEDRVISSFIWQTDGCLYIDIDND